MKLLAIDTATEGCSAALSIDGQLLTRLSVEPRRHAELILPMIDELLAEAGLSIRQLDAIAFGRGPGAFTGVRIATGVVQGIAFGADLPVLRVSTLRALAQRCYAEFGQQQVLCAFDARMNEVYWAIYQLQDGIARLLGEEQVVAPEQVVLPGDLMPGDETLMWAGAGTGWSAYQDVLSDTVSQQLKLMGTGSLGDCYPQLISRAEEIVPLALDDFAQGLAVTAEQALPVYLRNKVAWKKGER